MNEFEFDCDCDCVVNGVCIGRVDGTGCDLVDDSDPVDENDEYDVEDCDCDCDCCEDCDTGDA